MTTIEDQLRRYATQKVGPAVGDPPGDLPVSEPRRWARTLLALALLAFVVGLGLLALPQTGHRSPTIADERQMDGHLETATELGIDLDAPVSWPARRAPCGEGTAGVELEGPSGDGLCMSVAVDPGASFVRLEVYSHGRRAGAMLQIQPCNVANVRHFRDYYTATSEDGPILFGFGVPELETVAIAWPYDLGTPVIAKAFDLPGRDGLRFWAAYAPDGWENGFPHHFDAADDPVQMAEGGQDACLPDGVPLPEG